MRAFRKYLFGLLVAIYLFGVIGVPVYFHYCGGELEQISYFVKADGCCGTDDDGGCCSDQTVMLVNPSDVLSVSKTDIPQLKVLATVYCMCLPEVAAYSAPFSRSIYPQPPDLLRKAVISSSVIRI